MTRYGTWVAYGGDARAVLALVLLGVAVGIGVTSGRLSPDLRIPRPGRVAVSFLLLA